MKKIDKRSTELYSVHDPQFLRSMGNLLGPSLFSGNHVTTLLNGDEIFPLMLTAIRGAQQTITFETYIYWSGSIGKEFADALFERVKAGVKVQVMIDWVGSIKMDQELLDSMRNAGVELRQYHALR